MNMSTRFMFDTEFSDASAAAKNAKPAVKEEPVYSESDLAAVKAQAFEEGTQSGQAQAMGTIESTLATSLEKMGLQLQQLLADQSAHQHSLKQDAAALALAIAGKLAPALIEKHPQEEISQVIVECLSDLPDEPRIVVRASEQACEFLKDKVDEISAKAGFQGNVILLPEEAMQSGDCRVEWADGGVERNVANNETRLTKVINEFVHSKDNQTTCDDGAQEPAPEVEM